MIDWNAAGAIGEIIGAIAVVVSILYLAAQVHSNTKAMKANAGFEATHSWANANEAISRYSDEQLASFLRAYGDSGNWDSFSEIERMRISLTSRALFQKLEGQYYLHKYGTLDAGVWSNRAAWAAGLLQKPFFQTWWRIEKDQLVYSDDFVEILEATQPIKVTSNVLGADDRAT
jgi:hypothetical protein